MVLRSARRRALAAAVQAALAAALPGAAAAANWEVDPWVGGAIGYIHNIELNPPDQRHSDDWVAEFEAGFDSDFRSQRFQGGLNYRFRYLDYFTENQFDSSFHNLNASGQVAVVEDLFFVRGGAFYRQALVDPSGGTSFGNYFSPDNVRDSWGWNVSPILNHDFGYATFNAQYTYGEVYFTDETASGVNDDSTYESAYVSLFNSDPRQKFSWRTFYSTSRTEYESFEPYRYDQTGIELGWAVTRDIRAIGEWGLESDLTESTTEGGLDVSYWYVGAIFEPDARNRLELRTGERFFGNTYFVSFRHRAKRVEVTASYTEEPSTNTGRRVALPDTPPGEIPPFPDFPDSGDTRAEPFLLERAALSVTVDGRMTVVQASLVDEDQTYFDTGREVDSLYGQVSATRELGPTLSARVWYSWRNREETRPASGTVARDTIDHVLAGRLTRDIGRDLSASLETAYQWRREQDQDWAEGWWIGLRVRKDF